MYDRTITYLVDHAGDKLTSFEATLTYELTSDEIVSGIDCTKLHKMLSTAKDTALVILADQRPYLFESLLSTDRDRYTSAARLAVGSVTVTVKAGWV